MELRAEREGEGGEEDGEFTASEVRRAIKKLKKRRQLDRTGYRTKPGFTEKKG